MSYVNPNAMTVAEREAVRSTNAFGSASMQIAQREIQRSTHPFGGLGAVSAAKMNTLDSQARSKIPASLRNLFKVTPFIPKHFKDQFLAKPVSTMVSKFNVTGGVRSRLVSMINKSAQKQRIHNKTMRVGATNMKIYATSKMSSAQLASLWIFLMQRNPIASIQAVLEVQWGAVGSIISPVANAIGVLVGLGTPGLKGLGAASPGDVASSVEGKPPATSNEPSTAASVASSIGSVATIMTAIAAIAGIMGPVILPLMSQLTGQPTTPATQQTVADPNKVYPEDEEDEESGAQSEEEGGLPGWLIPVGIGLAGGAWYLSRKK